MPTYSYVVYRTGLCASLRVLPSLPSLLVPAVVPPPGCPIYIPSLLSDYCILHVLKKSDARGKGFVNPFGAAAPKEWFGTKIFLKHIVDSASETRAFKSLPAPRNLAGTQVAQAGWPRVFDR
jgi:hypothetical protein